MFFGKLPNGQHYFVFANDTVESIVEFARIELNAR